MSLNPTAPRMAKQSAKRQPFDPLPLHGGAAGVNVLKLPVRVRSEFIGRIPYADAVELMEKTIAASAADEAHIWGLEHPLVYTTGLKTEKNHILDPGVTLVPARRGGSVTLHNPGQLVVYFVFPLAAIEGGLERFVRVLEATLAEILLDYGVPVNFSPGASGVFAEASGAAASALAVSASEPGNGAARAMDGTAARRRGKIAFIGLGLKKNFIYHGVSLNVLNDLSDFRAIQSCGLTIPMARLADFVSESPRPEAVFRKFIATLEERFEDITPDEFRRRIQTKRDLSEWKLGFKLGAIAFHERRYWEAHEVWEMYWHEMPSGSLRICFHAMIQVAMAFYKIFTEPNIVGADSLLAKGLDKLHAVPEIALLVNQPDFILFLEQCHLRLNKVIEAGETAIPEPVANFVPPVQSWAG